MKMIRVTSTPYVHACRFINYVLYVGTDLEKEGGYNGHALVGQSEQAKPRIVDDDLLTRHN